MHCRLHCDHGAMRRLFGHIGIFVQILSMDERIHPMITTYP